MVFTSAVCFLHWADLKINCQQTGCNKSKIIFYEPPYGVIPELVGSTPRVATIIPHRAAEITFAKVGRNNFS